MRWGNRFLVACAAALALVPPATSAPAAAADNAHDGLRAGVSVVDATWNVGASAGQYASDRPGFSTDALAEAAENQEPADLHPELLLTSDSDPNLHATRRKASYGVQSRLTIRAIVVQGPNGAPIALVKSDNYLAQDLLVRRAGQLLAAAGSQVTTGNILHSATHNHSSPYYTTPAVGLWVFQDVMDLRMFEYQARVMARAIRQAEKTMKPVRLGATTVEAGNDYRNAPGGAVADDGSPTGYPQFENDSGLVVLRFDDISGKTPKPLAVWMNYGLHPESLDGYDLISADYVGPLERFVEREVGAPLVFTQGGVGSAEPANELNERIDGVVRAYSHQGYAQAERLARLMADKVVAAFKQIGANKGSVPWMTNVPVSMFDGWVPGPVSHPVPGVSNCRTEPTLENNPGIPVAGLPDCERPAGPSDDNVSRTMETFKELGVPIPEHYGAPSKDAVEENYRIHLQAVRIGDIALLSCSCEPQVDLIKNLESRTDATAGNIYNGFDWSQFCDAQRDGSWRCANPRLPQSKVFNDRSLTVSDAAYRRMVAQVRNDARGWDAAANAATAEAEPADPAAIKGNFTKEEIQNVGGRGYKLAVGLGHTGDYNGYTVSYRMYMSFDHYRKALTAYGPHTADYMVTRLVRMAAVLQGAPLPKGEPLAAFATADEARQFATATLLGRASSAAYDGWLASLPNDDGAPAITDQPVDITRFAAAAVSWRGGNNDVDQPVVRVERRVDDKWGSYADQTGEVQTTLALPTGVQSVVPYRTNKSQWRWNAQFEAADFFPRTIANGQVPTGTYRFVVDGHHRKNGRTDTYKLASRPFKVRAWTGITASGLRVEPNGTVSFAAAAVYPRTYKSTVAAIGDDRGTPICKTCTFRPWAASGEVRRAFVTIRRVSGRTFTVHARETNNRFVTNARLRPGDTAIIERGALIDQNGEFNGATYEVKA